MALAPRNKPPQLLAHHQAQRLGTPSAGDLQVAHHCATCVQEVIPEHSPRRACGVVSDRGRVGRVERPCGEPWEVTYSRSQRGPPCG
jgi:hypothetical protein